MSDIITIDGSIGEGGGQMLRTSLSLAAVYGRPFAMEKIRAKRPKPGLKRQHLACVRAVAEICGAKVAGDEVGSMALSFAPGAIRGGDYRFEIGTAGSATLVAQTVIPVLLKADGPSTVAITGGTHVPFSPPWEFFERTYLPQLRAMGANVEAELVSYGFFPAAGGEIRLRIEPVAEAKAYSLAETGGYLGGKCVGVVSGIDRDIAESEVGIVIRKFPELALATEVREVASPGPGNYCIAQLDYGNISVVFSEIGTFERSRKAVANAIVSQVQRFLRAGAPVEEHLADQLLVQLEVLGIAGSSEFAIQSETEHYRTNKSVIAAFKPQGN